MAATSTGTVKWFNESRGYGFIEQTEGPDVFARYNEIENEGFKTLTEGQQVEFEITQGEKAQQASSFKVSNESRSGFA